MHAERIPSPSVRHPRRRGATGLGRRQRLVLWLLADGGKSVQDMVYDHMPGLDEDAIRGAISGLERRSLIDVVDVKFEGVGRRAVRHYGLTERGRVVVEEISKSDDEDDDDA